MTHLLHNLKLILCLALMPCLTVQAADKDYTQYVNPWIGTGGHGHVFLGANVPFGLVQLGPTEYTRGWDWCSGYHYSDSVLIGFGQMHLGGTGIGDLGDVAFLPVSCCCQKEVKFSHLSEYVTPGYYSIKLADPNVFVELTATKRVGFHRYTFGADSDGGLIAVNLKQGIGWDALADCAMTLESPKMLTGHRHSKGWAKDQYVFFAAEFSRDVKLKKQHGDSVSVFRAEGNEPLLVKVALSAVSIDEAKANLRAELPGWDFNGTVAAAKKAWNEELGKIDVTTDDINVKTVFYTSLYHSMTAPSVFSDVSGTYRGADGQVHKGDFTDYTTFSLWDTYRAAHPLMTLIHPEKQSDIAETFIHIFKEQGKLPVWHLMGNETDCMVGNPGIPVLADLVLKGYVKNEEEAFQAMKASAMLDERGLDLLKQYDYLPYDLDPTYQTVAKGLEYALADACVAMVAKKLGKKADYKYFFDRSKSYRHYFDKKTGFIRALSSDGKFREPFNPFNSIHQTGDYTEGNAWQYTWLVPHDVHGLIKLFGSEERFVNKLDSLFIVEGDLGEEASPDISGLIGQYAHGNEPSHHVIYMYNYAGQPWKAAQLLRRTMDEMYRNDFDGLSGNEDVGQMSAWYILSSVGLYQVEPAGGKFVIGSPLFNEAAIKVRDGKTFTVKAVDNSKENIYVQSAILNGKSYTKSYITYQDIVKGGTLELVMGPQPSAFGTKAKDRP